MTREEKARALEVIEKAKQDFYAIGEGQKIPLRYKTNDVFPSINGKTFSSENPQSTTVYHEGYVYCTNILVTNFLLINENGDLWETNLVLTNMFIITNVL